MGTFVKKIPLFLFLGILLFSATNLRKNVQGVALAATNCDVTGSLNQTQSEQQLLTLINTYRLQNNIPSLVWSQALKQSATWQSNDMSTHSTFDHTDSLGRAPGTRIRECGYQWTANGENIFQGSTDPQAVFNAWKNSAPHNSNMLNGSFKEAGIGEVRGYWTLDLGASSSSPVVTSSPTSPAGPTPSPAAAITQASPTIIPTSTIIPTQGINTNPTDTTIDVSIRLNGIGETGNKSPKHLTRHVEVGVFDTSNKKVVSGNGFLKYDGKGIFNGIIHLGQIESNTYFIKIGSDFTLTSRTIPEFQALESGNENVLPAVNLIQGDLNIDNLFNIDDYNLALPCFQNKNCPFKEIIDFNDDGKADVIDYNLLLSSFRQYTGD